MSLNSYKVLECFFEKNCLNLPTSFGEFIIIFWDNRQKS